MNRARALRVAVIAGGAAFALRAGTAHAAPATAVLTTTSGAGAADCPDATRLAAIVNDGIGRTAAVPAGAAPPSPMQVAVSFERTGKSYAATVRIGGANGGTRKLANQGPGCGALANAVGVLLVVVLDAEPTASTDGSTAPRSPSGAPSPTAASQTTGNLGVGGGVAEGLVGGWSPTVGLGGTLTYGHWAARLGGVWLPSKSNDFGPGRVEVGLAIARLGLCVSTRDDRSQVALGFCLQQQVGWMRGRGVDYADNHETNQLWLAAGGAIVASGPLGRSFGWEADVGAVLPFREQRFTVGNLGTAYRSEPAAFMTTLTFTTRLW